MDVIEAVTRVKEIARNRLCDTLIMMTLDSTQHNDKAHNLVHVVSVVEHASELCARYEPKLTWQEESMVLAGALLHDLGTRYDRDTHHFISYGMAFGWLNQYSRGWYNPEETRIIADACLQHRSSYRGEYSSVVSILVALADRGKLDIDEYVTRSIQFHSHRTGNNKADVLKEVCAHIPDKFGDTGYNWSRYPALGLKLYSNEVAALIKFANDAEAVRNKTEELMTNMGY